LIVTCAAIRGQWRAAHDGTTPFRRGEVGMTEALLERPRTEVPPAAAVPAVARVELSGVRKTYRRGRQEITVLDHVDLRVQAGEFVALMGPSGSGKTTLLNLLAGIDRPSSGRVVVADTDLSYLGESALARWRARHVGFIFQFYNLVPVLNALDNVELPLLLSPLGRRQRRERARRALDLVGLGDRARHYPRELSGGQEQRVAVARAVVADPALLLADEPTGDLDASSAVEVLDLLTTLVRGLGKTIVMVTHDPRAAARADVVYRLDKGVLGAGERP
jgi:putative ABC transport system ATP-binding protein